ncbi:hypothetical protein [Chryseolinea soli]|uniref:Uncharacterized protein n=1 Tax=Chryseolinea soli TaxID=2321403 RepID=A0A385SKV5_9BACT|nr:hypothetical protein [Chryseolinea soli]AYB30040.1 hypothetical protein D4L85_05365 [Chryseolinea soli]
MFTLRNVLLINAVSSGATGLLLVLFSDFFAGLFGIESVSPFLETGIFLLAFAGFVFFEGRRNPMNTSRIRLIIVLDTLWVVASILLLLLQPVAITLIGNAFIAAVALWVAAMAILQFRGLKQVTA